MPANSRRGKKSPFGLIPGRVGCLFPAMNSLSNGFLYVVGMGWALTECCLHAVAGSWTPLILFLLLFFVMFAILGCLHLSDAAINRAGTITAVLLAVSLIFFSVETIVNGAGGLGALKLLGALIFVAGAFVALTAKKDAAHAGHHH